jgi:hypothetical protein
MNQAVFLSFMPTGARSENGKTISERTPGRERRVFPAEDVGFSGDERNCGTGDA